MDEVTEVPLLEGIVNGACIATVIVLVFLIWVVENRFDRIEDKIDAIKCESPHRASTVGASLPVGGRRLTNSTTGDIGDYTTLQSDRKGPER